jgi:hypothetical protein
MTPDPQDGPVVVLLDTPEALEWAAAEAATRGVELRIVHPFHWNYLSDELPIHETADAILSEARDHVLHLFPSLQVETTAFPGRRITALLTEARRTPHALLVLDHDTRLHRALARRTSVSLAIVGLGAVAGPETGRVVVLVEGAPDAEVLLGAAFRAARRRGTGVTVVGASPQVEAWMTAYPEVEVRSGSGVAGAALVVTSGHSDVPAGGPVLTVHARGASRLAGWSSGAGGRRLRY